MVEQVKEATREIAETQLGLNMVDTEYADEAIAPESTDKNVTGSSYTKPPSDSALRFRQTLATIRLVGHETTRVDR